MAHMRVIDGCRVEPLRRYSRRDPCFEVFAPAGKTFSGSHSLVCWDIAEVKERLKTALSGLVDCDDPTCDCRGVR